MAQLQNEPNAPRRSIIPPHKTSVAGVGANDMPPGMASDDDFTLTWLESWADRAAFDFHVAQDYARELDANLAAIVEGPGVAVLEFGDAMQMAKPAR